MTITPTVKQPIKIENEYLAVIVAETTLPTLHDKVSGVSWVPFPSSRGALLTLIDSKGRRIVADVSTDCKVDMSLTDDQHITISYHGLHTDDLDVDKFNLTVAFELVPNQATVLLTIVSMELEPGVLLESLAYPNHQITLRTTCDDGYLVVPSKQGVIVPTRFEVGYMRFQHNTWAKIADQEHILPFDSGALNMPWYGAVKQQNDKRSAVLSYVETSADAALRVVCNKVVPTPMLARPGIETSKGVRLSTLTPIWRASHGQLSYPRQLHLEIIPGGSYVDLAKRYRELAMASGRYRSLEDKIEDNPAVERLIGAPDIKFYVYTNRLKEPYHRAHSEPVLSGYECVHTTFPQVKEIVEDLHKNVGVDRALILLGGWIRAGYDREHPDVWPPAEKAGGIDGLREASVAAVERGYLFALHDNYQDMYPGAHSYDPEVVIREADGSLKPGGIWDGGPCQLICSSQAVKLATPTIDEVQSNTMANAYYLDTTTAAPLYECFSDEHPISRSQDREEKLGLLQWLQSQGFVVGAEAGTDWAVRACSFFEGLPGTAKGFFDGITGPLFGISTPLFSLVYHDAVVCYWQHGQPFGREDHDNHFLHDLLSANPSSWVLVADQWDDLKPLIKEAFDLLGELHRRTAHQQMVAHRFLTDDFAAQESRFEGGIRVVVNFGITSFQMDEHIIAPKGFLIEDPQDGIVQGVINRYCHVTSGQLAKRR